MRPTARDFRLSLLRTNFFCTYNKGTRFFHLPSFVCALHNTLGCENYCKTNAITIKLRLLVAYAITAYGARRAFRHILYAAFLPGQTVFWILLYHLVFIALFNSFSTSFLFFFLTSPTSLVEKTSSLATYDFYYLAFELTCARTYYTDRGFFWHIANTHG